MSIRLGTVPAIVVSSPKAASLFLKTHDTNFASRPRIQASDYLSYGSKGLLFTEYGPYWRNVKKLCMSKLLSASKTESFAALRKEKTVSLVQSLKKSAMAGEAVDLSRKIGEAVEDIGKTMILGRIKDDRYDLYLKGLVQEMFYLVGAFNFADYVPVLGALDLQGLSRRLKKSIKQIDQILEKIIAEHEQDSTNDQHRDFVDVLLPLKNKPLNPQDKHVYMIYQTNIKAILIELISAAFDTSAISVEWTISELLRNPWVIKKLQEEESFRLHPVGPFLVPRECREDITIEGYWIPKKSRIIVNTWAIGHDQNVWSNNVEEFYPERFMERDIDVLGHDFALLPFGSGRRMCPGVQSGLTTVRLILAQLVRCFDWERLPYGTQPKDIDMTEVFRLSAARANHLLLKHIYRLLK
ncbi:hypothetical protein FNV43_RR21309 [Rhamnella rubrinervis]|uniref:Cytochrome P450 n=1 Tax=Rhamnella rubrinervis TaxID=2594499 RepID=A0A8K0DXM6_9ROSA|nr:hypothetical protein FNV43_RR21309 [Rhamnella rubrinervis]